MCLGLKCKVVQYFPIDFYAIHTYKTEKLCFFILLLSYRNSICFDCCGDKRILLTESL